MKRDNLRTGAVITGFLLILIFVVTTFCLTFCGRKDTTFESSSSISEVEELIVEETTATETSIDVSTETTTTTVDETTTATPVESTETDETTTETSQEQTTATSQSSTLASSATTTETVSSQTTTDTTVPAATPATTTVTLKSNEEIAQEVWQGLWGVGEDRKNRLEAAGYDYNAIQKIVDQGYIPSDPIADNTDSGKQFVKTFTRGTYYAYGGPRHGGSGRQLIDCSQGDGKVKGSIASRYLYDNYGYNYNGKRTMVYLEVEGYSSMNGYYYLDDSCAVGYNNVIDFFYLYNCNCPFQYQGVVKVDCYIVK